MGSKSQAGQSGVGRGGASMGSGAAVAGFLGAGRCLLCEVGTYPPEGGECSNPRCQGYSDPEELDYATSPTTYSDGSAIRALRDRITCVRAQLADLEAELAAHLRAAGRRPGDGSDQATLFDVAEPNLFGGM